MSGLPTNPIIVNVARKIIYGSHAVTSLPEVCESLGFSKVFVVTGTSATRLIRDQTLLPLLNEVPGLATEVVEVGSGPYEDEISRLQETFSSVPRRGAAILAAGGGRVMDITKVASCYSKIPWVSLPTSASHDGFASPFINYVLRQVLQSENHSLGPYRPTPPLAIVGDTNLITKGPYRQVVSGVGDLVAKFSANKDWELAFRLRGEYYDEYAATFGLVSARIVEEGYPLIAEGNEPGVRLVVKALGNSGVAMSIAGNSRPASGSEHLISHYLDYMANEGRFNSDKTMHGFQVGLATVLSMYLHGGDWRRILELLRAVRHPTTFEAIGVDSDVLLEALTHAHTIRSDRYTILGSGLNKRGAVNAIEATGV